MENNITNKLIVILGAIVFSFAVSSSAYASYVTHYSYSTDPVGYESDYNYQQPVVNNTIYPPYYQQPVVASTATNTKPTTQVVNNYYYQTAPATKTTTTTKTNNTNPTYIPATSTSTIPSGVPSAVPSNNLGASAYNPYAQTGNGIAALSLNGSGSLMPSSIWQWIFVVILILIIVIIGRMFVHKPTPGEHTVVAH